MKKGLITYERLRNCWQCRKDIDEGKMSLEKVRAWDPAERHVWKHLMLILKMDMELEQDLEELNVILRRNFINQEGFDEFEQLVKGVWS